MPWTLKRFQTSGDVHFLTFSCHRLKPLLTDPVKQTLLSELERLRKKYYFAVFGYVLMPEHVHLIVSEPERSSLAVVLQVLKQNVSRRTQEADGGQLWQRRYYDFNVRTEKKFIEKLKYIHRNPVARGLVDRPEDWTWSTYRFFSEEASCPVVISTWHSIQFGIPSEEVNNPTLPNRGKDGAPAEC